MPHSPCLPYTTLFRSWDEIAAVVEALEIPVIGNGDVWNGAAAREMWEHTNCAGIMIARGSHGAPWIFAQARAALEDRPIPAEDRKSTRLNSSHVAISYASLSLPSLHDALPILG